MGEDQICGRKKLRTERSLDGEKGFVRNLGLTKRRAGDEEERT